MPNPYFVGYGIKSDQDIEPLVRVLDRSYLETDMLIRKGQTWRGAFCSPVIQLKPIKEMSKLNTKKVIGFLLRPLSLFIVLVLLYWGFTSSGDVKEIALNFIIIAMSIMVVGIIFNDVWDSDEVPNWIRKYFRKR